MARADLSDGQPLRTATHPRAHTRSRAPASPSIAWRRPPRARDHRKPRPGPQHQADRHEPPRTWSKARARRLRDRLLVAGQPPAFPPGSTQTRPHTDQLPRRAQRSRRRPRRDRTRERARCRRDRRRDRNPGAAHDATQPQMPTRTRLPIRKAFTSRRGPTPDQPTCPAAHDGSSPQGRSHDRPAGGGVRRGAAGR